MHSKYSVVFEFMRGLRLRYFGAIAAMLGATVFAYGVPLVTRTAIDYVIEGKPLAAPAAVARLIQRIGGQSVLARNLWIAGLAMFTFTAMAGVCNYFKGRWTAMAAESVARRIRDRLYDHLQHLPCAYHDKAETGDLVQRCTSDVDTVRQFIGNQVIEISRAMLMLLTALPIMLYLSPRMTVVALAAIPVVFLFSFIFFSKVKAAFKLSDEAEGAMTTVLQENLTGIRVVRAFARQEFECKKFAERNATYRDRTYRLVRLMAWYWASSDFLCQVQNGLVLLIGASWIVSGRITVGTLVAFVAYTNMFVWPLRQMGRILTDLGKAQVSLGRLSDILGQPLEPPPESPLPAPPERFEGRISFRNVRYSFDGKRPVLDDVSFDVAPGQTVALLGHSGSGKSTLVHLLLRFYDFTDGAISIDGRDIRRLDRKFVRSQIGTVLQEPFLYSKTLRDNIRLGDSRADEKDVIEAASAASLHETITGFEQGYQTLVGERGVTLSGGQRQRVALARAILKDPSILLLDDALSAVDTETEALILDALRGRSGRRTTLVIAHRLSTLMAADRIIVLDHGRVAQAGTHQGLLAEDGLYRRLWRIQSELEEDLGREMRDETAAGRAE